MILSLLLLLLGMNHSSSVVSGSWTGGQVWSYTNFLLVLTCVSVPVLRGLKSRAGVQDLPALSCYFKCLLSIS